MARVMYMLTNLQRMRATTLPVEVLTDDTVAPVLEKAVQKHMAVDGTMPNEPHVLLYGTDMSKVTFLPGTTTEFTVSGYKTFIGKSYQQLLFFICAKADYDASVS